MADPEADGDWRTEQFAADALHQLKSLAKTLAARPDPKVEAIAGYFAADGRLQALRPGRLESTSIGDIRVARARANDAGDAGQLGIAEAFTSLLAPHYGADDLRIDVKVIGVRASEQDRLQTEVLFQASSAASGTRVQQNAQWSVEWIAAGHDADPMIRDIRVERFDEITCPRPLMTDCTRGVIASSEDWSPQLALGCEYWYGRIDAVGEINFMGHNGIAVGDVNGDGRDDLYVAQGTGLPNKLFVQKLNGTVEDVAPEAGVAWLDDTKGVLLVDMDNDGDEDLLCAIGPSIVYCQNDGTGRFAVKASVRAGAPAGFYSLAAGDYDNDGDLDIYACCYVKLRYGVSVPIPFEDANNGPANYLLRNDLPRGFTDVTRQTGLDANNSRFSLAATWIDYDDDGDLDLYVANDFGRNNLYRNDGGRFTDVAAQAGAEDQAAGMGVAWSDYDLDGDLDLYVSNMYSSAGRRVAYQSRFMAGQTADARRGAQRHGLGNTLLANHGDGTFRDVSDQAGVRMGRWSWGSRFVDLNGDGFDDIVVPNGFLTNERKDDL
jgi:hypothetical protein